MTLSDVLVTFLATRGLVDIWRNGSVFTTPRELVNHQVNEGGGLVWQLLDCSFCLMPWAGFLCGTLICWTNDYPLWFLQGILLGFAAAGANYVVDGLLPPDSKIDRDPKLP